MNCWSRRASCRPRRSADRSRTWTEHGALKASLQFLGFSTNLEELGIISVAPGTGELQIEGFPPSIAVVTVKQLVDARLAARKAKNWAESDRIRDELAAMGIQLKDGKDPQTGEAITTWEVKR